MLLLSHYPAYLGSPGSQAKYPATQTREISHPPFKKGAKKDPGDYQPISLTSVPVKIMEQILLEDVSEHVKERGDSERQSAWFH